MNARIMPLMGMAKGWAMHGRRWIHTTERAKFSSGFVPEKPM